MPGAPDDPIAHIATVQRVLVDEKVSVSDAIVVSSATGTRFVDAGQVDSIHVSHVRTTLSAERAAGLPAPGGSNLVEVTPARSVGDRLGRPFGRWKR